MSTAYAVIGVVAALVWISALLTRADRVRAARHRREEAGL